MTLPDLDFNSDHLAEHGYVVSQSVWLLSVSEPLREFAKMSRDQGQVKSGPLVRGDTVRWVEETDLLSTNIWLALHNLKDRMNKEFFLSGQRWDVQAACFKNSNGYARHKDTTGKKNSRVLSLVFYTNPDWKDGDGGELVLYPEIEGADGDGARVIVEPRAGTFVLFKPSMEHEVRPSFSERTSVACWLLM